MKKIGAMMARTISKTVAAAIPVPENAMTKSLQRIINALEVREEQLLAAVQSEFDGVETGAVDVFAVARERGYLGT